MTRATDYLLRGGGWAGQFVQLVNNSNDVAYVSAAATDSQGGFVYPDVPAGSYKLYSAPTQLAAKHADWVLRDTDFIVPAKPEPDESCIFVHPHALDAWNAGLKTILTKHMTEAIFGASIAMGGNLVPNAMTDSHFEQGRDLLLADGPLYGDFYPLYCSLNFHSGINATWPWVMTLLPNNWVAYGPLLGAVYTQLNNGASAIFGAFTPNSRTVNAQGQPLTAKIIDLVLYCPAALAAQTFTITVDGAAPAAGQMKLDGSVAGVVGGVVTTGGGDVFRRLRITGVGGVDFDNTVAHVLAVTAQSVAGAASQIVGMCCYPTNDGTGKPVDAGFGFARFYSVGWNLHDLARTDPGSPFPLDKLALFNGGWNSPNFQFGFPFDITGAKIDIWDDPLFGPGIEASTSLTGTAVPLDTAGLSAPEYEEALVRLCSAIDAGRWIATAGAYGATFLFIFSPLQDPAVSDIGAMGITLDVRDYFKHIRAVRDSMGGASYDAVTDFTPRSVTLGWSGLANPHPDKDGCGRMAYKMHKGARM